MALSSVMPAGISNLSRNCYFNGLLHLLVSMKGLTQHLRRHLRHCTVCNVQDDFTFEYQPGEYKIARNVSFDISLKYTVIVHANGSNVVAPFQISFQYTLCRDLQLIPIFCISFADCFECLIGYAFKFLHCKSNEALPEVTLLQILQGLYFPLFYIVL